MKVSNCCGALPLRETYEDMGKCSKCKENAVFRGGEYCTCRKCCTLTFCYTTGRLIPYKH